MEIYTLGTSGAVPTKERRLISTAIKCDDGSYIILDIGEDFQRAFNEARLKYNKPTIIFISHMHADHVSGLPGFIASLGLKGRTEPLVIIGPTGIFSFIESLMKTLFLVFVSQTTIIEYDFFDISSVKITNYNTKGLDFETRNLKFDISQSEDKTGVLYNCGKYLIKGALVDHSVKSVAIRIEFAEKPGRFNVEKARELGITNGLSYKKLANGLPIIHDGKEINPFEHGLLDNPRPGPVISYSGDSRLCEPLINICMNSDLLISECMFSNEHQDQAESNKHLSSNDVAYLANSAKVHFLILTHFSNRYKDTSEILSEVKKEFENVFTASDLDYYKFINKQLVFEGNMKTIENNQDMINEKNENM